MSIFYFTLPLLQAHEHSDISLQFCMWGNYHLFLIALTSTIALVLQANWLTKYASRPELKAKVAAYRNQSIDMLCKSIDWFLHDGNFGV